MDFSFIQNVPFNEYTQVSQQGQYLTSHFLADFRQCPLLYWQKLNGAAVIDDTTAFQIGRAAHSLVLGGKEAFDAEYLVSSGPINPKTGEPYGKQTKAFKDWAAEQEKVIITESEFEFLQQLQNSVWNHGKAMELLKSGQYTVSEVGYMVGATSPAVFSRSFKHQFGISPSAV